MKKLSSAEKKELQQKIREYHGSTSISATREKGQSVICLSALIWMVILSAGIAVGSVMFMWQFMMDCDPFLWFFVTIICGFFCPTVFVLLWLHTDSGLKRLWRVILCFLLASALAVIVTVFYLLLGVSYGHWSGAWEGCVVEKYTYMDHTKEVFPRTSAVKLTTGSRKDLPYSDWKRINVGDYIVKKRRSRIIEIRRKP